MSRYVAIEQDGIVSVHASGEGIGSDYASLCGMDGDDSVVGQRPAPLIVGARIDCPQCKMIIMAAKRYRSRDFA
jgi:hypothetical protein